MRRLIIICLFLVVQAFSSSIAALIDNGDGTVTDDGSGLMWQQVADSATRTWKEALSYCENLTLAGYTDWRLPDIRELRSLVDYASHAPAIDQAYFPGTVTSVYWSSTTSGYQNDQALYIEFNTGDDTATPGQNDTITKTDSYYVRAVRGGQNARTGNLFIWTPLQASVWKVGDKIEIKWEPQGIGGDVKISLSRQGGKEGTFQTIAISTENDGTYAWTVTGSPSVNCMLRIEPTLYPSKRGTQGLFSIVD